jgi:hypothetical protein
MSVPITALATQPRGSVFCYGNDDGLVSINDVAALEPKRAGNSRGEMSIQSIGWADDGQNFAYSDSDMVTVKNLKRDPADPSLRCETVLDLVMDREGSKVHQILLNHDATLVLVVETDSVILWSSGTQKISKTLKDQDFRRWANHPTNRNHLLAFTPGSITSYAWKTLSVFTHWEINSPSNSLINTASTGIRERKTSHLSNITLENQEQVEDIIISEESVYALVLVSHLGSYHKRTRNLIVLDITHLQDTKSLNLEPIFIPDEIASSIERPLTVLGKDHFIFINKSFWVCSWHLANIGGSRVLAKYFFLPRDWISKDILDLCKVTEDGTFLCPRKGEVAVIRSSLGRQF